MSRAGYRRKSKVNVCCMCRQTFQSSRWDAKTCTPRCRKAWERFTKKQDELGSVTMQRRAQENRLNDLINNVQERVFARVK